MEESCSGKRRHSDCGGQLLGGRKRCCRPGLIVVLQKAQQVLLVSKAGKEMESNTLRIAMFQPIIEPLVVAEVEPLALQLILQVPVSLGDETEVRMHVLNSGDQIPPILGGRLLPGTIAPCTPEDLVQHKHGHVATDSIPLGRNIADSFNHCLSKPGPERIQ